LITPINAVAAITEDLTCNPGSDGEITIDVTGGSGNFSYEVVYPAGGPAAPIVPTVTSGPVGNVTTAEFSGLIDFGNYVFTITDLDTSVPGPACTTTATATIAEPTDPVLIPITPVNVSCNGGNDGSVAITLTDATNDDPPYTFTLTSVP